MRQNKPPKTPFRAPPAFLDSNSDDDTPRAPAPPHPSSLVPLQPALVAARPPAPNFARLARPSRAPRAPHPAMAYRGSHAAWPRESVYPIPATDFLGYLEDCIQATERCTDTLGKALTRLEPGTRDLPRLTKIFTHKHHFLVLPAPVITQHKAALSSSLAPQIDGLIARAETLLEGERGKLENLEARLEIIHSARLPAASAPRAPPSADGHDLPPLPPGQTYLDQLDAKDLAPAQRRKVAMLRGKRERLEKEKARLGL
ncbi:hypothetical protein Q5752_004506 [Cryptotrichosporon argae]